MLWIILLVIVVLVLILGFIKNLICSLLSSIATGVSSGMKGIFSGVPDKFLIVVLKLVACFLVIGTGSGIVFYLYKWFFLEIAVMVCVIAIYALISLVPIVSIFTNKFRGVPIKLAGVSAIMVISSYLLGFLYDWEFLPFIIRSCIVALVFFIVLEVVCAIIFTNSNK